MQGGDGGGRNTGGGDGRVKMAEGRRARRELQLFGARGCQGNLGGVCSGVSGEGGIGAGDGGVKDRGAQHGPLSPGNLREASRVTARGHRCRW